MVMNSAPSRQSLFDPGRRLIFLRALLCSVCTSWLRLMLVTPSFWTYTRIGPLTLLECFNTWMVRAAASPLHLHCIFLNVGIHASDLVLLRASYMIPYVHRICDVRFDVDDPDALRSLHQVFSLTPAPHIRRFVILFDIPPGENYSGYAVHPCTSRIWFTGSFPDLEEIRLTSTVVPFHQMGTPNLRALKIGGMVPGYSFSLPLLADVIGSHSSLRFLSIGRVLGSDHVPHNLLIRSYSVRVLHLTAFGHDDDSAHFASLLRLPSLRLLKIHFMTLADVAASLAYKALFDHPITLVLSTSPIPFAPLSLFFFFNVSTFDSVTTLDLKRSRPSVFDYFIYASGFAYLNDTPLPMPSLHTLRLPDVPCTDIVDLMLLRGMHTPSRSTYATLRHVVVSVSRTFGPITLPVHRSREWIGERLDSFTPRLFPRASGYVPADLDRVVSVFCFRTPPSAMTGLLSRLPFEICAFIFGLTLFTEGQSPFLHYIRIRAILCAVCRDWFVFIVNTPAFWTTIYLSPSICGDAFSTHVARARLAPLRVHVHLMGEGDQAPCIAEELLLRLHPLMDRVADVAFHADRQAALSKFRAFTNSVSAPLLQAFSVFATRLVRHIALVAEIIHLVSTSLPVAALSLPTLRVLRLSSLAAPYRYSFAELDNIFSSCPFLETVHLGGVYYDGPPLDHNISSNSITTLRLDCHPPGGAAGRFAALLRLPRLAFMHLEICWTLDVTVAIACSPLFDTVTTLVIGARDATLFPYNARPLFACSSFRHVSYLDISGSRSSAFNSMLFTARTCSLNGLTAFMPSLSVLRLPSVSSASLVAFAALYGASPDATASGARLRTVVVRENRHFGPVSPRVHANRLWLHNSIYDFSIII
ncbi:hypothetical protein C8R43DRAFT_1125407 [Mycena crocata]|nr:hypothetical protein C8R43DRAFT_1125407 [Mycena crocata]